MSKSKSFKRRSTELRIASALSMALFEAHEALYACQRQSTAKVAWNSIKKFEQFLITTESGDLLQFERFVLRDYFNWLHGMPLHAGTRRRYFYNIRALLGWCQRNKANVINGELIDEFRIFQSEPSHPLSAICESDAKRIMDVALQEIFNVQERLRSGREELAEKKTPRAALAARLLELGGGRFPLQRELKGNGEGLTRLVRPYGGLKAMHRLIFPMARDLVPFLIAIQFQVAGNPQAIMAIGRSCLRAHPLRDDREWVVWTKHRSRQEQRVDFSSNKATSAPSLIRILLELTQPLAEKSGTSALFVCYERGRITVPTPSTWHLTLQEFCRDNSLPHFAFSQLRRTSAELHHRASGSELVAKQRLNHVSLSTTQRYLTPTSSTEAYDKLIVRHQVALATQSSSVDAPRELSNQERQGADTVFGFRCTDPYNHEGKDPNRDRPCDSFFRCATCPGAVVPLDSVDVVASIIASLNGLEALKNAAASEGWSQRFGTLYQPTLNVIKEDLLPKIPPAVLSQAAQLAALRPFPPLE